jgi:D-aspartate ligase
MPDRRAVRAFVMGDRDLVVPLHTAGAAVTVVSPAAGAARYSRYADAWLPDPRPDEDALVTALLEAAARSSVPATLFYQQDDELLLISRRRKELGRRLGFVIPSAELVRGLVDKAAFTELATRLDLPVPATRVIHTRADASDLHDLTFPVLVKPLRRVASWDAVSRSKAVLVADAAQLTELLDRLAADHPEVIAQRPVPGPESRIESYHVYVGDDGGVAAEFTGCKIRTYPRALGHSTAVTTTDAPDVVRVGRDVIERLGLRGVAKVDFKRDDDGRLWLLEVNPRFNLWHHVGAAAGVNLPAFVLADLLGLPRPPRVPARPGVRWCRLEHDIRAARQDGLGYGAWLRWAAACETRSTLDPLDPLPLLGGKLLAPLGRMLRGRLRPNRERPCG